MNINIDNKENIEKELERNRVHYICLAQQNNYSFDEAMLTFNKDWDEDKWKNIELNESDYKVGDVFTTTGKMYIVCNSSFDGKMHNDAYKYNDEECVSYLENTTCDMTQSGDILKTSFRTHVISFKNVNEESQKFFVVSSGWAKERYKIQKCTQISLSKTRPILEIRIEEKEGENVIRKRFIVQRNFECEDNKKLAFVNTIVEYDDDTKIWKATVLYDFI
jgi:hypothetical protein